MNKANECTCPSGDGSLVHPCPAHPAVEQAGGDERAADAKPCATRCPDCGEHDLMPGDLCACGYETDPATGYACSECDGSGEGCVGEVCRECDGSGWFVTPDQASAALAQPSPVLPPFAEKVLAKLRRFYDCASDFESGGVDIGRRWLDLLTQLGLLNRIQRSPALWEISQQGEDLLGAPQHFPAQAEAERPEVAEVAFVLRNIGAMDAEDIDGDNVDLRFEDAEGRDTGCDVSIVEYAEKAADLFEQHERIVGALRAEITQLRQHKNDYMDAGQETYRALQNEIREREAEIARLDGLVSGRTAERDAALAEIAELEKKLAMTSDAASKGDAARHAAGGMEMEIQELKAKLADAQAGRQAGRREQSAYELLRQALKLMPLGTKKRAEWVGRTSDLLCIAQAQHSVPELDQLYSMLGAESQVDAAKKIAELVGCRLSRSALTEAQMRRLYDNSTEAENERLGFAAFARLMRRAEAVHQIAAAPGKEGL
ncbi:hypothetical protein AAA503_20385 [Pseudomonas aeruginosa]